MASPAEWVCKVDLIENSHLNDGIGNDDFVAISKYAMLF
jgi:hypothetical protein